MSEQSIESQKEMFGMTIEDIEKSVADTVKYSRTKESGLSMFKMSLLSDVQYLMDLGGSKNMETARQHCNVVKYLISEES